MGQNTESSPNHAFYQITAHNSSLAGACSSFQCPPREPEPLCGSGVCTHLSGTLRLNQKGSVELGVGGIFMTAARIACCGPGTRVLTHLWSKVKPGSPHLCGSVEIWRWKGSKAGNAKGGAGEALVRINVLPGSKVAMSLLMWEWVSFYSHDYYSINTAEKLRQSHQSWRWCHILGEKSQVLGFTWLFFDPERLLMVTGKCRV